MKKHVLFVLVSNIVLFGFLVMIFMMTVVRVNGEESLSMSEVVLHAFIAVLIIDLVFLVAGIYERYFMNAKKDESLNEEDNDQI